MTRDRSECSTTNKSVVVASKGRADECATLLDWLARQTVPPDAVLIIGVSEEDLPTISPQKMSAFPFLVELLLCERAGSTFQRNVGLDWLAQRFNGLGDGDFVVFMDDDFRPASDWIEAADRTFRQHADIVGLTGWVLADGVKGSGLSDDEAKAFISGTVPPQRHWSDCPDLHELSSAYGCNMAFRASAALACRFDEALPLYGWQEDTDFTGQTRSMGKTVLARNCRGVHLGSKRSRTSGIRFGYSQIANPIRIAGRGNMTWRRALRFTVRACCANLLFSIRGRHNVDYFGRLRGNLTALKDIGLRRCQPARILDLEG